MSDNIEADNLEAAADEAHTEAEEAEALAAETEMRAEMASVRLYRLRSLEIDERQAVALERIVALLERPSAKVTTLKVAKAASSKKTPSRAKKKARR